MGNVNRVHFHEPDTTVDSGARIPATAIRFHIGSNGDVVFLRPVFQVGREVVAETHVSTRALAQKMPVDPDLAVHVNTVKIDGDFLAFVRFRKRESLAIPAHTPGKVTYGSPPGHLGIIGQLNTPVVWHIQNRPFCVVETRRFSTLRIT